MGLDFVDLNFRIEKRFGIEVQLEAWEQVTGRRQPFDLTAGEACALVEDALRATRARLAGRPQVPPQGGPVVLDYQAPGDGPTFDGNVWPELQRVLADMAGVGLDEVHRDAWLARDLGLSW